MHGWLDAVERRGRCHFDSDVSFLPGNQSGSGCLGCYERGTAALAFDGAMVAPHLLGALPDRRQLQQSALARDSVAPAIVPVAEHLCGFMRREAAPRRHPRTVAAPVSRAIRALRGDRGTSGDSGVSPTGYRSE